MSVRVEVQNLPELIRALRNNANLAKPIEQAFRKIGLEQLTASVNAAPHNFGKLRDSIKYEVDRSPLPTYVRIGTIGGKNVEYAAYMEYGTGTRHDHPSWPKEPHRIPTGPRLPSSLALWAKRKGKDGDGVAWRIMRRGGLEPRRYLRGPFERRQATYVRYLTDALRRASLRG